MCYQSGIFQSHFTLSIGCLTRDMAFVIMHALGEITYPAWSPKSDQSMLWS